ncbi:MAG: ornithine carbamoyltransferase [Thermoprotei archaeon]|nr:MAG: ornithine carbamoyltransferase [Thermoprotei archaeon]RLF00489.1 MAG: ornithine carbamoyltransferase [Thermoprotei archaeon]
MKHLLSLSDISREDLRKLVELTEYFKKIRLAGNNCPKILSGKSIGLLFEKPSTRTRVSLEVAIVELGGYPVYMDPRSLQLARGEPIKDTARVLSRYLDAIVTRVYSQETLIELKRYSDIPVINALSDKFHPLQAISDMFTLKEHFGFIKGLKLAFIGDGGSNVCHSLLLACSMLGVSMSVACPPEYQPQKDVLDKAKEHASVTGAKIEVVENPEKAVEGADAVYTDVFVSMGFEKEREKRLKIFLPRYQVNRQLLKKAKNSAVFMHCLPAKRGEEVTEDLLEDPEISIVWTQAENRLHSAKAVLAYIFGKR